MPVPHHQQQTPCQTHVLVIEADPTARAAMATLLEASGYRVTAVATVEAAITNAFWAGRSGIAAVLVTEKQKAPRQFGEFGHA